MVEFLEDAARDWRESDTEQRDRLYARARLALGGYDPDTGEAIALREVAREMADERLRQNTKAAIVPVTGIHPQYKPKLVKPKRGGTAQTARPRTKES